MSTLTFSNGTELTVSATERLSFPLGTWLAAGGIDLNALNTHVAPDMNDQTRSPYFRTTGVKMEVLISNSNRDKDTGRASNTLSVRANVTVTPTQGVMARLGTELSLIHI